MKALDTSFPASDYAVSRGCCENSFGLKVLREFAGGPHRATNYDPGSMVFKVNEWTDPDPFGDLFDLVDANMKRDA